MVTGINRTHPAALHLWCTTDGGLRVLLGSLETLHCNGPCSVPSAMAASDVVLQVNVSALGLLPNALAWTWGPRDAAAPALTLAAQPALQLAMHAEPQEAHVFDLRPAVPVPAGAVES